MPKFRVTSPDGRTFVVDAPEGATKEQALAQVQAHHAKAAPRSLSALETAGGLAGNALDAMIPGFAGASRGTREVLVNALTAPFSDRVDFEPGKAYRRGQDFIGGIQKRTTKAHPTASTAADVTGIGLGFALPASKIVKGASLGQKALAGAKTAGAYGAISGAMSSKADNLWDRASDAVSSGASSALVGGVLPVAAWAGGIASRPLRPFTQPLTRMVGKGLQGLGDILPGSAGAWISHEGRQLARDPVRAAADQRLVAGVREAAHPETGTPMRPRHVAGEVQRRQSLGVPAVAADLDDGLRRQFRSSALTPGPVLQSVRRRIDARQQQQAERTARHVAASLGAVSDVERQAEALNRQARTAAAPLYEQAYQQPIPVTHELQELFSRPAGRTAIEHASTSLQNQGISPVTTGKIEGADGVWREGQVPTMQLYDYAKSATDHAIFAGQKPFATPEASRDMRGAIDIRKRLLAIMDGDGSGPRFDPPAPVDPKFASLPKAPPIGGATLPPQSTQPGPWTGERLQPEGDAASEQFRSGIPPEGLNPFWKPARDAYAGAIQNKKALELGEDMAKADAVDAANRLDGMSGSQVDHFRLGHRSALAADVRRVPDYGDAAKRLAGSWHKREAIETVHGPDATRDLFDRLKPEQDAAETWKAVRGNPGDRAPSISQQDQAIEDAAKGVIQTLAGQPGAGLSNVAKAIARGDRGGQEMHGHIASVLAEPDVKALSDAMRQASRERARRLLVEQNEARAVQQGSRFLGPIVGTNMIEPTDDQGAY